MLADSDGGTAAHFRLRRGDGGGASGNGSGNEPNRRQGGGVLRLRRQHALFVGGRRGSRRPRRKEYGDMRARQGQGGHDLLRFRSARPLRKIRRRQDPARRGRGEENGQIRVLPLRQGGTAARGRIYRSRSGGSDLRRDIRHVRGIYGRAEKRRRKGHGPKEVRQAVPQTRPRRGQIQTDTKNRARKDARHPARRGGDKKAHQAL